MVTVHVSDTPIEANADAYLIERDERLGHAHQDASIKRLCSEYLGAPLAERSHHLLHASYAAREVHR